MRYRFTKMQGCGNDYVYMDCFTQAVRDPSELARQMSDRHFGVGSDGLILVCPPTDSGADFRMRMFNADGSEGRMCGNGVRCAAVFARRCGIITGNEAVVQTLAGSKRLALGQMHGNRCTVRVQMGQPSFLPADLPALCAEENGIHCRIPVGKDFLFATLVSVGSPHCVIFSDENPFVCELAEPDGPAPERLGRMLQSSPLFPVGVNVEFVWQRTPDTLYARVWERGSGETLSCGTGACAVAAAAVVNGRASGGNPLGICMRGGELFVTVTDAGMWLSGDAVFVFDGETDMA